MEKRESHLLGPLLRDVSRSFYKTLKLLPISIRKQISLAYLLARTTDTIADTELIPSAQRLDALNALRARILGESNAPINFTDLARRQATSAEATLLNHAEASLALLATLSKVDLELVRKVLDTITSGQELDLKKFAAATAQDPVALETEADLDDYTFRVAGCVGEFWTRICRIHVFPKDELDDDEWLIENGIRFGKGLQLVNVLRDLPADLRKGRCYLPAADLSKAGLRPRDLGDTHNEPRVRPVYDVWLQRAQSHLAAGWDYTLALPWRAFRVRVACALPILIGMQTVALLKRGAILDSTHRIKVERADVKRALRRLVLLYPLPSVWNRLGSASSLERQSIEPSKSAQSSERSGSAGV